MNYLPVEAYGKLHSSYDCTAGGVSVKHNLFIECADGYVTDADLDEMRDRGHKVAVLEVHEMNIGRGVHRSLKPRGEDRWVMFGGNFAWTSDSRGRDIMPNPLPIHDRIEG